MICKGVEHVKSETRHVLNLGVGRAIVTLGAVLMAEETGHALASELTSLNQEKKTSKTHVNPDLVSLQSVLAPQLSRPSVHSSRTQAPS